MCLSFIRGSSDAMKQAHALIAALIKDPEADIVQMLQKSKLTMVTTPSWDKTVSTVAVSNIRNRINIESDKTSQDVRSLL